MESNRPPETLATNRRFGGSQIPPKPRSSGHRRALSETFVRLPEEFLFDSDPDFNISDIDLPSISDDNVSGGSATAAPGIPVEYGGRSEARAAHSGGRPAGEGAHLRSMSFDELTGFQGVAPEKRLQHQHSSPMDGESLPVEEESAGLSDYAKKGMPADKLSELALIDPKRAKRILANRQSAARSKERKIRYTSELELKVQTLQSEATTLSAQVTLLQRDTTGLTSANRELKLRLQAMEQQAQLRDALNDTLREEVQRLKIATTQIPNGNECSFNRRFEQSVSAFYARPQHLPSQGGNFHAQLLHLNRPVASSNGQAFNDRSIHDSMELM